MTTHQYHIQKEKQAKDINHIVQTVKRNSFPKEVKTDTISVGGFIVDTINAQSCEVRNQLDKTETKPQAYNHKDEVLVLAGDKLAKGEKVAGCQSAMLTKISNIIKEVEMEGVTNITKQENFTKFARSKDYNASQKNLLEALHEMKRIILDEKKEATPETKSDEEVKTGNTSDENSSNEIIIE